MIWFIVISIPANLNVKMCACELTFPMYHKLWGFILQKNSWWLEYFLLLLKSKKMGKKERLEYIQVDKFNHYIWNCHVNMALTILLFVSGQHNEEVHLRLLPASGEKNKNTARIISHTRVYVCVRVCACVCVCVWGNKVEQGDSIQLDRRLTFSNRVSSSLTSFCTSSISALKHKQHHKLQAAVCKYSGYTEYGGKSVPDIVLAKQKNDPKWFFSKPFIFARTSVIIINYSNIFFLISKD